MNKIEEMKEIESESDVCVHCDGTGEIANLHFEKETHRYVWDGTRPCQCVLLARDEEDGLEDYRNNL